MLAELSVRDLGVIAELDLVFGPGLVALTGETGAGKTLVVEALELLLGGRADPALVRAGASEAAVEGRFIDSGGDEVILARVLPATGRSRAYVDGRMATTAALEARGAELVDLYGQHAHQSLLRPGAQREALDRFAAVELGEIIERRREIAALGRRIDELGRDDRTRRREIDLLAFELREIEQAAIAGEDEDEILAGEEDELAAASALREATALAYGLLSGEANAPGALERLGGAVAALSHHRALGSFEARLRALGTELDDAASELRLATERFEEDPERLAELRARRQLLRGLVRKHGESLADVIAAGEAARTRLAELEAADSTREALEAARERARAELARHEEAVGDQRRAAAPLLAAEVQRHLRELALGRARVEAHLSEHGLADDVELLFGANPGEPALPLTKVASGGELARAMLALRLVLTSSPPTMIFDEVDAGIGGEAAIAVGRALAELGRDHQVLVVTHLPQVAAYGATQLVVEKREHAGRTITTAHRVEGEARVAELSRMLAGRPGSGAARAHAEELLAEAEAIGG